MELYINDRRDHPQIRVERLEGWLRPLLAELQPGAEVLEIDLLDDVGSAALNERFFSRPQPANVLSFPLNGEDGHLGGIALGVDAVLRETEGLGYSPEEAVLYYIIHGLLHLLGYEHIGVAEETAAAMEALQEKLFAEILSRR